VRFLSDESAFISRGHIIGLGLVFIGLISWPIFELMIVVMIVGLVIMFFNDFEEALLGLFFTIMSYCAISFLGIFFSPWSGREYIYIASILSYLLGFIVCGFLGAIPTPEIGTSDYSGGSSPSWERTYHYDSKGRKLGYSERQRDD